MAEINIKGVDLIEKSAVLCFIIKIGFVVCAYQNKKKLQNLKALAIITKKKINKSNQQIFHIFQKNL